MKINDQQLKSIEDLLAITKALDEFKYKCYAFMASPEINRTIYQDFLLKNAPCNYGFLDRFENVIEELKTT